MVKIHSFPRFQTVTRDSDVIGQKKKIFQTSTNYISLESPFKGD